MEPTDLDRSDDAIKADIVSRNEGKMMTMFDCLDNHNR
jgi:hypothetical protein